jgi:hypothetical protein
VVTEDGWRRLRNLGERVTPCQQLGTTFAASLFLNALQHITIMKDQINRNARVVARE